MVNYTVYTFVLPECAGPAQRVSDKDSETELSL